MAKHWSILSLGGSIIVPDEIDVSFLKKFRELIRSFRAQQFAIICGGGTTNRRYNAAAKALGRPSDADLDWIGIRALSLNAELVRAMFGHEAHPEVVTNPAALRTLPRRHVVVGSAFKTGASSDMDAILWAKRLGAKRVLNLSNIDYVYTADPRKDKRAKPIRDMSWTEYLKIVGTKWSPRMSSPFDPMAAKLAQQLGVMVGILNGRNLANVKKAIRGVKFNGSILQ